MTLLEVNNDICRSNFMFEISTMYKKLLGMHCSWIIYNEKVPYLHIE